jgi:isoleucyl-tRNA synthetase
MFQPVETNVSFPQLEERVLEFWRQAKIYDRSLEQRQGAPSFVFFEGPPTANGKPHPGHCLTRAMKDLFPRYRTMRGYRCERKAGWDTHGLPVEVEVCKELGIHSKEEIEAYGVEPFIQKCQKSVWQYMQQWERLTERLGFWIHLDRAYVTYHQSYVESVWWSLTNLFDRGLLYQGHKIVWWWAQGGTALSSGEVGQGYRSVADPSVFVLFPLLERPGTSLLVWTTTPWTLPSNQFAAVHPEIVYATVRDEQTGQRLILAEALVEAISQKVKRPLVIESTCLGRELIGLRYEPPFDFYYREQGAATGRLKAGGQQHLAWRIVAADFVTTDSGSGAVHEAPAFGEVDFELLQAERERFVDGEGPAMICAVAANGRLTGEAGEFAGLWVKEADQPILRKLKENGKLFHQEQYVHEYPFCWRAENDPLIQYPRKSWFIRTTKFKERMLANNALINWLPEHIRDGRFGNFLQSNVDWALSRERYWGTPLPIWVCEQTGQMEAVSSYAELLAKPGAAGEDVWLQAKAANPELVDDLKVHKPYIDHITYDSPYASGSRMRRVSEVIDCWYDSGAMPFAQWGYPHRNQELFSQQFPADFISEALDQTRGWFYSLLSISTMLFSPDEKQIINRQEAVPSVAYPHPFQNCIVLGLMLAESNVCLSCGKRNLEELPKCPGCGGKLERRTEKMSKSLRNYREPQEIFDTHGADALRWYFYANQPPWNSIVYSERAIKESIPEFLLRLWNVYGFFVLYANLDEFNPAAELPGDAGQLDRAVLQKAETWRDVQQREELDRWVLAELDATIAAVTTAMDAYDNYGACSRLSSFVDMLSNWYVRRSRERFWSNDKRDRDKLDAYWTLYECLLVVSRLIAPFVPFTAEAIWRNLTGGFAGRALESVHLADYPSAAEGSDGELRERMSLLREIASLGRAARMESKLKVRQPLAEVTVALNDPAQQAWLAAHDSIVRDELNVKQIRFTADAAEFVTYQIQPNFKRLGPLVGPLLPKLKATLQQANGAQLLADLNRTGKVRIDLGERQLDLGSEDIQVRMQAKGGWAAAQGAACVVVLDTKLTDELVAEGYAQDVKRLVQDLRKQRKLEFSDRIRLSLWTDSAELKAAVEHYAEYLRQETLALEVVWPDRESASAVTQEIGDYRLLIDLEVVRSA